MRNSTPGLILSPNLENSKALVTLRLQHNWPHIFTYVNVPACWRPHAICRQERTSHRLPKTDHSGCSMIDEFINPKPQTRWGSLASASNSSMTRTRKTLIKQPLPCGQGKAKGVNPENKSGAGVPKMGGAESQYFPTTPATPLLPNRIGSYLSFGSQRLCGEGGSAAWATAHPP